ncbi:MAG: hypothetical protein PHQ46_13795, partial [Negativicutes bacterium]|nr:hypothetical protein [Negativicutes bacterium]
MEKQQERDQRYLEAIEELTQNIWRCKEKYNLTEETSVVITANAYLTNGGEDNVCNLFLYLCKQLLDMDASFAPPS